MRLHFDQGARPLQALVDACPSLAQKFRPTCWCSNGHAQTFWAFIGSGAPKIHYQRQLVGNEGVLICRRNTSSLRHTEAVSMACADGGTTALDWVAPVKAASADAPVLLLVPGLSNTSAAKYVRAAASVASKKGWHACVVNYR